MVVMQRVTLVLVIAALCEPLRAEDPPAPDSLAQAAEMRLLRAINERQQREIAALQAQVKALTAQLTELGVPPAGATRPAQATKPKRVVFVLDYFNVGYDPYGKKPTPAQEVIKAVEEMSPDQWFNVVYQSSGDPVALQQSMLPANKKSVDQLRTFLAGSRLPGPNAVPAMAVALKWKPDVIWYVGGGAPRPEQFLSELRKLNSIPKVRISTTTKFLSPGSPHQRFLWELANEWGGVCVDQDGNAVPEPPVAIKPEVPKPAPGPSSRPSVLRNP